MAKDLVGRQDSSPIDVIVQFNQSPSSALHQRVLKRGGRLNRELQILNSSSYSIPAAELAELAVDPDVVHVSPDRPLATTTTTNTPARRGLDHHREVIDLPSISTGLNGSGIGVAIIDSGIAPVADLSSNRIVYSQDFTFSGSAVDQYGHGTHVAGIIAGNGSNSTGSNYTHTFKGIASSVNLINLRVLDQNGAGSDSEAIAAIETAIRLKSKYNIRVINLSLGRGVFESFTQDPLCQAVEQAWKAGIVVVVAGGNFGRDNALGTDGYATITAPGNDPYVITVGAMNTRGSPDRSALVPTSYSSKGPGWGDWVVKPDLVAPGNSIISLYTPGETLAREEPNNEVPTSLYEVFGT